MKKGKIAVTGVNGNPEKFGYKIFSALLDGGYDVEAVGIRGGELKGKTVYKSLSELPAKPALVLTVVPPAVTDKIVDECIALGIEEIWMQPGSRSETAVKKAREAGIKVTDKGCFMSDEGIW